MTEENAFLRVPPPFVPLCEVPDWLREVYDLNNLEIRSVMIEVGRIPLWFRVAGEDEGLKTWDGWAVDWEAGCARWKDDPPGVVHRLSVSWAAVMDAVKRSRTLLKRTPAASRKMANLADFAPDKMPFPPTGFILMAEADSVIWANRLAWGMSVPSGLDDPQHGIDPRRSYGLLGQQRWPPAERLAAWRRLGDALRTAEVRAAGISVGTNKLVWIPSRFLDEQKSQAMADQSRIRLRS